MKLNDVRPMYSVARGMSIDLVDAQRLQVGQVVGRHFFGHLGHGDIASLRFGDQLVIDVRDIDHPGDLIAAVGQIAFDRVEDHRTDHVADVGFAIDGGTAQVDPDVAWRRRSRMVPSSASACCRRAGSRAASGFGGGFGGRLIGRLGGTWSSCWSC